MISADSIQYMVRRPIKDTPEQPLTVLELRNFLNRLLMGGCGDFKIINRSTGFGKTVPTHYDLNGHNNTITLD